LNSLFIVLLVLLFLAFLFRPLLFASIDPTAARARGVPTKLVGLAFLILLAAATAVSIQTMGVLLSSALLVAPAGAAHHFRKRPLFTLVLGVVFALGITWTGLALAFFGPMEKAPVSFYLCVLAAAVYGISVLAARRTLPTPQQTGDHHHELEETGREP
jgi:zinc/manganese transport system permease protein